MYLCWCCVVYLGICAGVVFFYLGICAGVVFIYSGIVAGVVLSIHVVMFVVFLIMYTLPLINCWKTRYNSEHNIP